MNNKNQPTQRTQDIISRPIGPMMFKLTVPMVLAIVSMMLLGVVDAYFVSRLGTAQLAAVSFAIPITQMGISIALGIGMAISSLTSRLIGKTATTNRRAWLPTVPS